jgi:hypothetical protein
MPGRAPSPVPRRPGSAERWEHDGAAADAAAAARAIAPPKRSSDSRQQHQQEGPVALPSAGAQPPQTAVQKAAAAVPDRVASAGAEGSSAPDSSARGMHPTQRGKDSSAAIVHETAKGSRQQKQDARHSEGLRHDDARLREEDGRRSASPAQERQKIARKLAVAGPVSRWLLLLGLCSDSMFVGSQAACASGVRSKQQQSMLDVCIRTLSLVDSLFCCNVLVKLYPDVLAGGDQASQGVWWDHRRQLAQLSQWDLRRASMGLLTPMHQFAEFKLNAEPLAKHPHEHLLYCCCCSLWCILQCERINVCCCRRCCCCADPLQRPPQTPSSMQTVQQHRRRRCGWSAYY